MTIVTIDTWTFLAAEEGESAEDALKNLEQGKDVTLKSEGEVNTLIDRLKKITQDAKAKGEKAPNYDLCQVSVPGTNLFCGDSLGIPRLKMPQLGGKPRPDSDADKLPKDKNGEVNGGDAFRKHLEDKGVGVEDKKMNAAELKPSQGQLVGSNVAGMMSSSDAGEYDPGDEPIFVSRDGYVIDGHHRWAAMVGADLADGKLGEMKMNVRVIDMDIKEVLDEATKFSDEFGILAKEGTDRKKEDETKEEEEDDSKESEPAKGQKVKGTDKEGNDVEGEVIKMIFGKPQVEGPDGPVVLTKWEKTSSKTSGKKVESAWADIIRKARRLRADGAINIIRHDIDVTAATVRGDTNTYNVVMYRQFPGSKSVTMYECNCKWGEWAFQRKKTFVGRMCSHALATLYEMQSREMFGIADWQEMMGDERTVAARFAASITAFDREALIDEEGSATNLNKLDLTGTHYITESNVEKADRDEALDSFFLYL